jgi:hypothetical protein
LFDRVTDQALQPLHGGFAHHGADHEFALQRIADRQRRDTLGEPRREIVRHFLVDDDTFGGHADLPGIGVGTEYRGVHRRVEIGIVEHHQRRLASRARAGWA